MAPHAADIDIQPTTDAAFASSVPVKNLAGTGTSSRLSGPLIYSGSLDSYEHFDVTSVIGREFPKLQLSEILDDDSKVRDLAILGTIFLFFRVQHFIYDLTHYQQSPNAASSSSATKTSPLSPKSSSPRSSAP